VAAVTGIDFLRSTFFLSGMPWGPGGGAVSWSPPQGPKGTENVYLDLAGDRDPPHIFACTAGLVSSIPLARENIRTYTDILGMPVKSRLMPGEYVSMQAISGVG
jgi:hypothetical protein